MARSMSTSCRIFSGTVMVSKAREALRINPSEAIFPGLAITLVVMSFSLVGDGLRDALDPKLKNVS